MTFRGAEESCTRLDHLLCLLAWGAIVVARLWWMYVQDCFARSDKMFRAGHGDRYYSSRRFRPAGKAHGSLLPAQSLPRVRAGEVASRTT